MRLQATRRQLDANARDTLDDARANLDQALSDRRELATGERVGATCGGRRTPVDSAGAGLSIVEKGARDYTLVGVRWQLKLENRASLDGPCYPNMTVVALDDRTVRRRGMARPGLRLAVLAGMVVPRDWTAPKGPRTFEAGLRLDVLAGIE